MSTKQELLDREDAAWHELSARLARLDGDDWARAGAAGEWTPRDVIVHVACWHSEAVQQFEQLTETGKMPWWPNVEEFNQQSHAQCLDMSLHDAQAMLQAARHRFREEIARLAEPIHEKIERAIAGCGSDHYAEHIQLLDAFFAGAGR